MDNISVRTNYTQKSKISNVSNISNMSKSKLIDMKERVKMLISRNPKLKANTLLSSHA